MPGELGKARARKEACRRVSETALSDVTPDAREAAARSLWIFMAGTAAIEVGRPCAEP